MKVQNECQINQKTWAFISNAEKQVSSSNVGSWGFWWKLWKYILSTTKVMNAAFLRMLGDLKWWDTSVFITALQPGSGHPRATAYCTHAVHLSKHTCKARFLSTEGAFYLSLLSQHKKGLIQLNMTNFQQSNRFYLHRAPELLNFIHGRR